ncbi:MAG: hypothetical protein KUG78_15655 [Kangiellaceae bacterium]|nr:hypothetical protein [Kangiellaceae bacterium]
MTEENNQPTQDDWEQLQNDWQSFQPDIVKIKRRIEWVTWRMSFILFIDLVFLFGYVPFLIYFVLPESTSLAEKIWHIGMFPVFVYGVYWDFKLRLPLFRIDQESTQGILGSYLARVKAGITLGDIGFKFSLALVVLFLLWVGSSYYFELGEEKLQRPTFILFGVTFISSMAGIMYWYRVKKQKEYSKLKELWKEFLE